MKLYIRTALSLATIIASACHSTPPVSEATRAEQAAENRAASWTPEQSSVLYARDGSVVAGEQAPSRSNSATPAHDVQPHDGSRMYLLDLYQKALDEKEALALEVKNLAATLDQQAGAQKTIEKQRDQALAQLKQLEAERNQSLAENADLSARLTTAQIRRLEAEKLLLETKIEAQRAPDGDDALSKKPPLHNTTSASAKSKDSALKSKDGLQANKQSAPASNDNAQTNKDNAQSSKDNLHGGKP